MSERFVQLSNVAVGLLPAKKGIRCFNNPIIEHIDVASMEEPILSYFKETDLLYNSVGSEEQSRRKFAPINNYFKEGNSQMSMLLMETYFFCKCIPRNQEDVHIIYLGSYPGEHINFLVEMFPRFKFHLFDQRVVMGEKKSFKAYRNLKGIPERLERQVREIGELFTDEDAINPRQEGFEDRGVQSGFLYGVPEDANLYLISDMRDTEFGAAKSTAQIEKSSKIVENDMENQLRWARELGVKYALMRFTAKPANQRLETDKLYFDYAPGRFLKIPIAGSKGGAKSSMFIITNDFEEDNHIRYYHDDVLAMIEHHISHVITSHIYNNPFDGTFSGYISRQEVIDFIDNTPEVLFFLDDQRERALEAGAPFEDRFMCSAGFDHRAMLCIMGIYCVYAGIEPTKENIMRLILRPHIIMELYEIKYKSVQAQAEVPEFSEPASPPFSPIDQAQFF